METKLTLQGKTYNVIEDGDGENVTTAPAPMIRFELTFKGTPYCFWLFVKENGNLPPDLFYTERLEPQNDDDNAHVYFRSLSDEKTARYFGWTGAIRTNQVGCVKAETTPEKGKAHLIVSAVEDYWPELSKTWEILHTALDHAGWIESGAAPDALASPNGNAGDGQGEKESAKSIPAAQHLPSLRQNSEYIEKIESLQNILLAQATGQAAYEDENEYRTLRDELIQDEYIKPLLPRFVLTNRRLSQFWAYIKAKFKTYKERREYIWAEFAPLLGGLENGSLSYVSDEDMKIRPL